jgi:hypothetical protein
MEPGGSAEGLVAFTTRVTLRDECEQGFANSSEKSYSVLVIENVTASVPLSFPPIIVALYQLA